MRLPTVRGSLHCGRRDGLPGRHLRRRSSPRGGAIVRQVAERLRALPRGQRHELAHLAFFHLAGKLRAQVEALYREAEELGWVAEAYALKNPDEFFAVSYTDWLRQRFGLPLRREPDEAGIFDRLTAVFEALARDARE